MAQDLGLAFRLSVDAGGLVAGISEAEVSLEKVGKAAQASSKDFRAAAKVLDSVATPAEKYASTLSNLDDLLAKGTLTWETHGRAVAKAAAEMEKATGSAEKLGEAVKNVEPVAEGSTATVEGLSTKFANLFGQGPAAKKLTGAFDGLVGKVQAFAGTDVGKPLVAFGRAAADSLNVTERLSGATKVASVAYTLGNAAANAFGLTLGGLVNPGVGVAQVVLLLSDNLSEAIAACYSMAAAVSETRAEAEALGVTFESLNMSKALAAGVASEDLIRFNAVLSALDVRAFDDLALAVEESTKGQTRLGQAAEGTMNIFGGAFTGLLEGFESGLGGLSDGLADLVGGFNELARPIAQALRPFGTLIGVILEAAGGLIGMIGELGGVVLRLAGIVTNIFLSPVIVGFNNFADTIKAGVGGAFEYVSQAVAFFNKGLDLTHDLLKGLPFIGAAFASNVPEPQAAAPVAGKAVSETPEEVDDHTAAIGRQEEALGRVIDKALQYGEVGFTAAVDYETGLRHLNTQLESGILNETSYAQSVDRLSQKFNEQVTAIEARAAAQKRLAGDDAEFEAENSKAMSRQTDMYLDAAKAAEEYGARGAAALAQYEGGLTALNQKMEDGRLNATSYAIEAENLRDKFKGQIEKVKELQAAEKKRADDIKSLREQIGGADDFQETARKTLGGKSNDSLQVSDVRSSEGIKTFMSLMSGREDPAIAEHRKSNDTLRQMLARLRALEQAPLEIAGGAGR
ncbi:hypothetical protein UFOVP898_53 [uncultured Caudovirales phage]|uniref:Uncharacterized protein n=1 Tax=uncultured Caudovirales phage TaxID=2100421 RepID=A0A6J7X7Q7_9CAUD|nr:hypothetical protein UFOVP898_53 [uncultured Caudovirales phage]CAB4176137.1 hypothetical protein UFOVP985_6 [uncultured Caudovirales phage]CAB4181652.1 hypothetical protein UFOVP1073_51 [uncultured Caudovirales phage]CAB4197498.1 hypothetical protein UFOVP1308_16 [uncultured Caudovirales phage]CAB4210851.1 hypothetical protein UFOVP1423_53 [uncultured Caudovirales phage]